MMQTIEMRRVGLMLAAALAWLLWPAQAQAQAFPCNGGSNGAGPGERMVGMSPGGPGNPSFPLCVRDNSGGAPGPAMPQRPAGSHAALAWHADAADVWVDGNYVGANNIAERGALDACNRVMGGGCRSPGAWSNSSMAIIRNRGGDLYNGWLGEGGADRDKVLAECSAKQLLPCEVIATIKSSTNRRSPGASVRKLYAASAWVVGTEGYDHKLYVASGHRDIEVAKAAAVKACADATSRTCEATAWTGNGFIQAYTVDSGESATAETSAQRARQAAQINCRKQNSKSCNLMALFDSRKQGLFVHDFKAKAP
jgi:hypothetical protein